MDLLKDIVSSNICERMAAHEKIKRLDIRGLISLYENIMNNLNSEDYAEQLYAIGVIGKCFEMTPVRKEIADQLSAAIDYELSKRERDRNRPAIIYCLYHLVELLNPATDCPTAARWVNEFYYDDVISIHTRHLYWVLKTKEQGGVKDVE